MAFLGYVRDSPDSPTFSKPLVNTRQTRWHSPSHFTRTRLTCKRWVWPVLGKFGNYGKFVEFGEFCKCRLDHVIHKNMFLVHETTYIIMCTLGVLAYSHPCKTCRHSPSWFGRTHQTRPYLPNTIFEKNVTRLAKFGRVLTESRKFGASGHCLPFYQESKMKNFMFK